MTATPPQTAKYCGYLGYGNEARFGYRLGLRVENLETMNVAFY